MDALFTDHLVLQRDRPIPIWGHAAAGEEVTVTLSGATRSVRANADGRWALTMPELPAGGPHTLTARTANRMTNAHDVLVGDVWLCSGQSNMEFSVRGALNSRAEIAASANDGIRQVRIPHASSTTPRDGFDAPLEWKVAGPDTTADFSAVCYFYARDLAQSTQAPQGLVVAAWGGSKIQPWMSEAALRSLGGSETVLDIAAAYRTNAAAGIEKWGEYWKAWWRANKPQDQPTEPWGVIRDDKFGTPTTAEQPWESWGVERLAKFNGMAWYRAHVKLGAAQAKQAATLSLGLVDEVDISFVNGHAVGSSGCCPERSYAVPAGVLRAGDNIVAVNVLDTYMAGGMYGPADKRFLQFADGTKVPLSGWKFADEPASLVPPRTPWEPTAGFVVLYNAIIAPLGQYGFRGAVWYQGESNTTVAEGKAYQAQLQALMADWRRQFGTHFPFFVVQLANYGSRTPPLAESGWALTREAQRRAVLADGNAALAVTIDIGNPDDVHPTNKQEVGRRLALAARKLVYGGSPLDASGTQPASAQRSAGAVLLNFGGDQQLAVYGSRDPDSFQLCGKEQDSCRYARAQITGKTAITLETEGDAPATRVRYCWADSPACNLYDGSGIPVGPFEIDIK